MKTWFLRLWSFLRALMQGWFSPARLDGSYRITYVEEEPDTVAPRHVYAVGENGHLWHVVFVCPCGCGARLALNLLPDDSPRWEIEDEGGVPTIRPSVWRTAGCRSHFFLRRGSIEWVRSAPNATR